MKDDDIIKLYWDRNEQAIRETQARYGFTCFRVAQNILKSREDCEECVNETWLRAWNGIPPAKPNNLKQFLITITRNLAAASTVVLTAVGVGTAMLGGKFDIKFPTRQ